MRLACSNEVGVRARLLPVIVGPGVITLAFDVGAQLRLSESDTATLSWTSNELAGCRVERTWDGAVDDALPANGQLALTFDTPMAALALLVCTDASGGDHIAEAVLDVY